MNEFRGIILEGRQAMRIVEPNGNVLFEKADDGTGGRPEVQRAELRQLLLDALPAGTVQWGRKVSGTRGVGEGRYEVTFADGSTVVTGLLVGADGAWSRVRARAGWVDHRASGKGRHLAHVCGSHEATGLVLGDRFR